MSPHLTALLGLVLCLAQTIHTQEGALPRPSISAEPGTVIPPGNHVTFMCRTSGGPDSPDTEPGSSAGTVPGTEASGFDAP
uniref:Ig-like domain-containing protein n=1 Tax=Pan paniscus TaxID=9597 RepID=A0A2R9BQ15_PANPA